MPVSCLFRDCKALLSMCSSCSSAPSSSTGYVPLPLTLRQLSDRRTYRLTAVSYSMWLPLSLNCIVLTTCWLLLPCFRLHLCGMWSVVPSVCWYWPVSRWRSSFAGVAVLSISCPSDVTIWHRNDVKRAATATTTGEDNSNGLGHVWLSRWLGVWHATARRRRTADDDATRPGNYQWCCATGRYYQTTTGALQGVCCRRWKRQDAA